MFYWALMATVWPQASRNEVITAHVQATANVLFQMYVYTHVHIPNGSV